MGIVQQIRDANAAYRLALEIIEADSILGDRELTARLLRQQADVLERSALARAVNTLDSPQELRAEAKAYENGSKKTGLEVWNEYGNP